jgi:hypothetical protein
MSAFNISLETANRLNSIGWWGSLGGAIVTAIAICLLMWGTRVRDRDMEVRLAQMNLTAAQAIERAATLGKDAALLRLELAQKTEELARATAEARALATRDVFRPLSPRAHDSAVAALRRFVPANDALRLVRVHHYNINSPGMNDLYAQIDLLLTSAGIAHEVGDQIGTKSAMVLGPSGLKPQPPITLFCALGGEAVARRLGDALATVLKGEVTIETKPRLPAGIVEIGIFGQPQFNDDGTVSFR